MSKYTVIVHSFGSYDEYDFDTREEVFNFVTLQEDPITIFRDGEPDNPREDEAITDWLARQD
jgi:hypothetical protein